MSKKSHQYETLQEASDAAIALNVTGKRMYKKRYKEDSKLPSDPDVKYKDLGWEGWDAFLGKEKKNLYETHQEASDAAIALNIIGKNEYKERYKEDPKLTSTPESKYKDLGWEGFAVFLGKEKKDFYETLQEASDAAIALNISNSGEYERRYKEDPKLPSNPDKKYSDQGWEGFDVFLGKEKKDHYVTHQEASDSAIALNISSGTEYRRRYKEDPKLPSNPHRTYENLGWDNWNLFLGKEIKEYYETLQEASDAAITLYIRGQAEYQKRYKEDPKLPSSPDEKYKVLGWEGFDVFLGKEKKSLYETLSEASDATIALNISSPSEYKRRYKEDPKLPATPDKKYAALGWESFDTFLGKEKTNFYETLQEASDAALALNISSGIEYGRRYKEDPKLPAYPDTKYKDQGWEGWRAFLGKEKKEHYETLQEASDAALALNISSGIEYGRRYKEDPKLPAYPDTKYKDQGWEGWRAFLGKEKKEHYETLQEASDAALALNISSGIEYGRRYKEDPKLPSVPEVKYAELGWINWDLFLSKNASYIETVRYIDSADVKVRTISDYVGLIKKDRRFPNQPSKKHWPEYYDWASFVGIEYKDPLDAIALIKDQSVFDKKSYESARKLYRALPESPENTYGFYSFEEFLAFNKDKLWHVDQVRNFCHENKITTNNQYRKATTTTPYLAINKEQIVGFSSFSNITYSTDFDMLDNEDLAEWHDMANKWVSSLKRIGNKIQTLRNYFLFNINNMPSSPAKYCDINYDSKPDINAWLNALSASSKTMAAVNAVNEFFDFVLTECCAHTCEETGEVTYLEGYSNPIKQKDIQVELDGNPRLSESRKPALPFRYIDRARKYIVPADSKVTNIRELFDSIDTKTEMYSYFSEWFHVDESVIDKNDPNCVWRYSKGQFQMWSPVRLIALYTQLFMPFRGSQTCWLDSGEADSHILTTKDGKHQWEENLLLDEHRVPEKNWQGFLKPTESLTLIDKNNTIGVSCHVNTNKTAKNAYIGYDVPWVDERIVPWIIMLRDWQTKYNPLVKPTKWTNEYKSSGKASEYQLKKYGYNSRSCFLFRDPTKGGIRPLTQAKLSAAFCGLLYLIQDEELPLAYLSKGLKSNRLTSFKAHFTLHSMRVSLITAFVRDAQISPEIVQKLVGHSSLVMTIYYTKVSAVDIQEQLQNADNRIIKNQVKRVEQLIKQKKMEQAKSELIGSDGELVKNNWEIPAAAFSFMDYGICPNGRTLCNSGGKPLDKDRNLYAPASPGYLGTSNCIQCRHFVTGPAFLGGLQMIANEISLECKAGSIQVESLRNEIEIMEDEEYQAIKKGKPFLKQYELSLAESHYEQEVTRFDALTCDLVSIIRLSMNSVQLLNRKINGDDENSSLSLVATNQGEVEFQLSETSDFIQLDMVCHSASYYQSSHPKNANIARTQFLDLFARKNGLSPGMFMLDERQQLEVGNELTKFIFARTGSWDKVSTLMDKDEKITLKELGFDDDETQQGLTLLLEGKSLKNNILSNEESKLKVV
ncbi:VPA1269 family protein [Colwellia sp. M166]|uniref:gamma-mobile-trio integrase GmtZ n=1 Tax=Colwellia sp. M166 TaxID=2583805 RepID=UPI00211EBA7B|nr:VPA1269 family protein [Colwellia sp. M166]